MNRQEREKLKQLESQRDWVAFVAGLGFIGGWVSYSSGAQDLGITLFLVGFVASVVELALES